MSDLVLTQRGGGAWNDSRARSVRRGHGRGDTSRVHVSPSAMLIDDIAGKYQLTRLVVTLNSLPPGLQLNPVVHEARVEAVLSPGTPLTQGNGKRKQDSQHRHKFPLDLRLGLVLREQTGPVVFIPVEPP